MNKKFFILGVLVLLSIYSLSGCEFEHKAVNSNGEVNSNQLNGSESTDSNSADFEKITLNIGNFDGDLGHEWLQKVADNYTSTHSNVKIAINNEKDNYGDALLLTNFDSYNNDLYLVNSITYSNYVNQDKLLDITEAVTTDLDGEDKSIVDKLSGTLKDYYNFNNTGKYYALPFFDSIFGTVYDVDLFDDEQFYFNTDGELICNSSNETKSAGPNNIVGDFDDGLPQTYSQWKTLVDTMNKTSIIPYTWTGMYPYYRARFLTSIWADYEGKENFDLNQTLNGSYTFDGDVSATTITNENGYLLQNQKGKEYALEMVKYIISHKYYSSDSFYSTNTHLEAQQTYLLSCVNPNSKRIGMILEGGWWENGAKPFFAEMANTFGQEYGYGERKFGFMPAPKSDDGKSSSGTTLISSTGNSAVFISKKTANPDLAKDFLRYLHSDESLQIFTSTTGSVRPYDYELTQENRDKMSYYAKTMFDIYRSEDTQISYITLWDNDIFIKETAYLGNTAWFWGATINGTSFTDPFYEFSQNANLTVAQYIAGMKDKYSQSQWNEKLSKYFN